MFVFSFLFFFVLFCFVFNRPFPSSLVPLLQNESKCETFLTKISSVCSFISCKSKSFS